MDGGGVIYCSNLHFLYLWLWVEVVPHNPLSFDKISINHSRLSLHPAPRSGSQLDWRILQKSLFLRSPINFSIFERSFDQMRRSWLTLAETRTLLNSSINYQLHLLYQTPATTTTQKYLLWVYQKYPPLEEKYPPCCTVVLFQGQEKCTVTNPGKEAGWQFNFCLLRFNQGHARTQSRIIVSLFSDLIFTWTHQRGRQPTIVTITKGFPKTFPIHLRGDVAAIVAIAAM